jgi:deferrochelatase/peroxidase EfeB
MSNALITIIAPLDLDLIADAEAAIDKLGNPARADIRAALDTHEDDENGTHFASLHAIRSQDGKRGYIAFEFSADGTEDDALARINRQIGENLRPVFILASDWKEGGELLAYLRRHKVATGNGWFSNPGALFAGTPGLTVGRIRGEAKLGARITGLLARQGPEMTALERVMDIRNQLKEEKDALTPATASRPFTQLGLPSFVLQLFVSFVKTYLWPIVVLLLLCAAVAGISAAFGKSGIWHMLGAGLLGFLGALWTGFWIALLLIAIAAAIGYGLLRRAEENDSLEERAPPHAILAAMFERENQRGFAQNHMISVTQRKPGAIRWFTSRLVFWAVAEFAARYYRPGFLSDIGTIHFARWITTPGNPDILFFSNYDSSWESYLEDFITRAHAGLTAIWSNSIGFPRSENLFQGGATDGERFKRYARQSMVPTRFWYSAYPQITTTIIRTNAEIRRGLSGSMTEDEAIRWLALFGSAGRPASKLVSSEIQSLVFGGLGFLEYGTCLLFDLPDNVAIAQSWLKEIKEDIAFNDGRRLETDRKAALTLALGARGLKRLGLPEEGVATFPFAFVDGMTTPARARILGDTGKNAVENWTWGRSQPDVALLVYGTSKEGIAALAKRVTDFAAALGMKTPHEIPLKKVADDKKEPFGFVDGVSQPVIRGTYKGMRSADPIHLVEAGEFVLGYPDNRGNMPPGPTLPAISDPANQLPLVGATTGFERTVVEYARDLGFNGTFLVIRQLEQDIGGFWRYCEQEATRLAGRLRSPYEINRDFIAAKLIGRWRDGSSVMRYPYESRSSAALRSLTQLNDTVRPRTTRQAPIEAPPKAVPSKADLAKEASIKEVRGEEVSIEEVRARMAPAKTNKGIRVEMSRKTSDNDFLFGTEDPEALRCPFGSHIRRANPRDSLDPGSNDQIEITNRHRIMRVGRVYENDAGTNPGLLFMCLNGDIERQFEFVQQTWLMSPSFHGLSCEKDAVLGDGETGACGFTIPSRDGPIALAPMPAFITTKGGGYFFMPGKRLIEYLSAP